MLKLYLASFWLVAACMAAPAVQATPPGGDAQESSHQPQVEVLKQNSFVGQDGYNFEFSSSDGTSRQERGELVTVGDRKGIAVQGSYEYAAPGGQRYRVTFTADQHGYKPEIHLEPAADGSGDQPTETTPQ